MRRDWERLLRSCAILKTREIVNTILLRSSQLFPILVHRGDIILQCFEVPSKMHHTGFSVNKIINIKKNIEAFHNLHLYYKLHTRGQKMWLYEQKTSNIHSKHGRYKCSSYGDFGFGILQTGNLLYHFCYRTLIDWLID